MSIATTLPRYDDVEKGLQLPPLQLWITRRDLVRYAGVSTDCNTIHWSDRAAEAAGLPGVVAHGLLTMAMVARIVSDWTGDPAAIIDYQVRFGRPVVVPDDDEGATVEVTAKIGEKRDDNTVRVDITARFGGQSIFGRAYAIVRLA
ncbi:MaoC/PaaZ C-terminal domain-containing protein [Crossiella sp. CA198]|uniref:MaoC/PaaZ C-terminal domain-containing protein n=1 Tax=Crossiella sp. CA198 TaxID=3455607 RepID=UPI003F8D53CE